MHLSRQSRIAGRAVNGISMPLAGVAWLCFSSVLWGQNCQPHFEALGGGMNSIVQSLAMFDSDGSGPAAPLLCAGGYFTMADGKSAKVVAQWDGNGWLQVGEGINYGVAYSLASIDLDGDGPNPPQLHAGGDLSLTDFFDLNDTVHWDGTAWSVTGGGIGYDERDYVLSLATFDDDGPGPNPPALYAGGWFYYVNGFNIAYNFARWTGSSWQPIGEGNTNGTDNGVYAMTVFDDDGDGPNLPALFIGGFFSQAGGTEANAIAKFDGKNFSPLDEGITTFGSAGLIHCMTVYDDDGQGPNAPALMVAGRFMRAGGEPALCVAKWDGSQWSPLGGGINAFVEFGMVYALAQFDEDGAGPNPPRLFAAGKFSEAGGNPITNLARWDGTAWSAVGGGVNDPWWIGLTALTAFDPDGPGGGAGALILGGIITDAGGVPVSNIAAWIGCEPVAGDVNSDGFVNAQDLLAVITAWGPCPQPCDSSCVADVNGDCAVAVTDLIIVLTHWS